MGDGAVLVCFGTWHGSPMDSQFLFLHPPRILVISMYTSSGLSAFHTVTRFFLHTLGFDSYEVVTEVLKSPPVYAPLTDCQEQECALFRNRVSRGM